MPRLSPTDWRTQVKTFERFGCRFVRRSRRVAHRPTTSIFPFFLSLSPLQIFQRLAYFRMTMRLTAWKLPALIA